MQMISIVCVYNKELIFKENLLKGLENQSAKFELIKVDNTNNAFKSAAQALNYGGRQASGKYIMFVHQDIFFPSPALLEHMEQALNDLSNPGIVGVAGVRGEDGVLSNIEHCVPPRPAGTLLIDRPEKVQTLDECLLIIPRSVFSEMQFDEEVCDNWHLYAVEYCLRCHERGRDVYVIPEHLYHVTYSTNLDFEKNIFNLFSPGSLPKGYYPTLKKVLKKYRKSYPVIYTTCGVWKTRHPLIFQRLSYIVIAELIYYKQKFLK